MILARTGSNDDPIDTPSTCSYSCLLKEKVVLVQESKISFFKVCLVRVVCIWFSAKVRFKITLTVFSEEHW